MIFQYTYQDFPYWGIVVPHRSHKMQLFSPPIEQIIYKNLQVICKNPPVNLHEVS